MPRSHLTISSDLIICAVLTVFGTTVSVVSPDMHSPLKDISRTGVRSDRARVREPKGA